MSPEARHAQDVFGVAAGFLMLLAALTGVSPASAGHYEDGDLAFKPKDYDATRRLWQPLAEAGHARAQLGMATLYHSGLGVVLDYERAFDWCAKSADQEEPQARYVLGSMYRDPNYPEACYWLDLAGAACRGQTTDRRTQACGVALETVDANAKSG